MDMVHSLFFRKAHSSNCFPSILHFHFSISEPPLGRCDKVCELPIRRFGLYTKLSVSEGELVSIICDLGYELVIFLTVMHTVRCDYPYELLYRLPCSLCNVQEDYKYNVYYTSRIQVQCVLYK